MLIRYGNFFQYVRPILGGHASVGMELRGDPLALVLGPLTADAPRSGLATILSAP